MHELGHNLGLHHGGSDDTNNKPNYLSVMNYLFQFTGVVGGTAPFGLDYSSGTAAPLNENALDDSSGLVGVPSTLGTRYFCGNTTSVVFAPAPINWGCTPTPLAGTHSADVNGDGSLSTLTDNNDWASLNFGGGVIGMGALPPPAPTSIVDVTGAQSGGVDSPTDIENKLSVYTWTGFFPPLNADAMGNVVNSGKAGRTYPVKFQLQDQAGNYLTSVSAVKSFVATSMSSCTTTGSDITASPAGTTAGLHYDLSTNQFIFNWASPSTPGCYTLKVNLADGTTKMTRFELS